jgi:transcriptional regulator with XRE-family HTH domain
MFVDVTSNEIPSDVVGRRVREVRERRGLSVQDLSERCAEKAGYELSAQALYNLENGRRDKDKRRRRLVTVEELLALSAALDVAPVHLLADPEKTDDPYSVTDRVSAPASKVRSWVRGFEPLGDTDPRTYFNEVPAVEWGNRPEQPGRDDWLWEIAGYLTRSAGRLYRRDDRTVVLEVELPTRGRGDGGESGEAAER